MNYLKVIKIGVFFTLTQSLCAQVDPGGVAGSTTWFLPETAYMTLAGSNVTQWDSYVGVVNVNQATTIKQPLFNTVDISANFNGSVLFDGTSDELEQISAPGILGDEGTVIAVFRHLNVSTAFGSNADGVGYQMKHYNVGYSNISGTEKWQRTQNATTPAILPTHSSKTRINFLLGGTSASTYLRRNGSLQTALTSTTAGAIVNKNLSFGSAGSGVERSNIVMQEVITFDFNLTAAQMDQVETYLAIKYGVTLGVNGTGVNDYFNTSGVVVYDATANAGYSYEVAGIGRDDLTGLSQLKSHSTNGPADGEFTDIVTVSNGTTFATPTAFSNDQSYFIWGHNGGVLNNTNAIVNYTTDNSEIIEAVLDREWKAQESVIVDDLVLEFDLSTVAGAGGTVGTNDLANLRLLVDEDGDFSVGSTSYAPISYDNTTGIAYFLHDFNPTSGNSMDQGNGFFFTLGTTDMETTPLPVELISFDITNDDCTNKIDWSTASELNCDYFEIEKSYDGNNWTSLATVKGAGNSNVTIDYSYRDNDFSHNGIIYYRIVQVDTDGDKTEIALDAVNAWCTQNYEPITYPNPVTANLNIKSIFDGEATIRDLNGRIVGRSEVAKGTTVVGMSHLTQGTYMLTIELVNGKSFISQLVKM